MEQKHFYTDERNAQIVIALLKAHGIKRVIASPGTTHMAFLGSIQYDPWFQIWSAIDERHAAFMAVGMVAETGEPVVLTCTGATASRNYLPALTEAFYRKLPILAITSSQLVSHIGNLHSQVIDRSEHPKDTVKYSLPCPPVENDREARECELAVNKAILELFRHGGGPVHINLESSYNRSFKTATLPAVRKLERYFVDDELPRIPDGAKVAVFITNHKPFTKRQSAALEKFLSAHNAVALCEATSSWCGSKKVVAALVCAQGIRSNPKYVGLKPDLVIVIGEACNDYPVLGYLNGLSPTWYVNVDGEARDRFGTLEKVFEMPESCFFERYAEGEGSDSYFKAWMAADAEVRAKIPELPFSNLWIAQQTLPQIQKDATVHIGLSTSLQSWTAFLQGLNLKTISNVGTCGIDGCVSTMIGASVASSDKLFFGVVGDLTFFYDLNSLGNHRIGKNFRLMLVNNGCGGLFHTPNHQLEQFTDALDDYMAAGGHFGAKSPELVKHYVTDLGFKYLSATDKDSFAKALPEFLDANSDKPIVFECFVDVNDDRAAWGARMSIDRYVPHTLKGEIKKMVPQGVKDAIKSLMR